MGFKNVLSKLARLALTWLGIAQTQLDALPPGVIDVKDHERTKKWLAKLVANIVKVEAGIGAHTEFWPTIIKAPRGTRMSLTYPDGTVEELHADTVPYVKAFKTKGFDTLKKIWPGADKVKRPKSQRALETAAVKAKLLPPAST